MSVYKKKNGKWYCRFQINSVRKHLLCAGATNEKQALAILDAERYKLRQQQAGLIPKEEKGIMFSKLCTYFLNYSKLNKKSYKQDKCRISIIQDYFKIDKPIKNIKPIDIERLKQYLLDNNRSKVTVNRYLEILSKMFNMAIDNDWLLKNPVKNSAKFPEKNYTVRYLSSDEEKRLYNVLPRFFKPIVTVALNTGLRKRNILDLKWNAIDFQLRTIEVLDNKGNKFIKIFMNDVLYNLFKEIPIMECTDYIFPNPKTKEPYHDSYIKRAWKKVKEEAGIENLRFHDLRHTVGTRLAQANIPVPVIKELLAHSDISTTMRYVHTASSEMEKAMLVLNSYN